MKIHSLVLCVYNVYCNNDDGVFEFVNSDVFAFEYTQVFNSGSVCNNEYLSFTVS